MGAYTDRLLSPCHHPPVSSLLPRDLFGWTDHTMVPSQLQATPTPRRCDGSKDKQTQTNERSGICHLGRYGSQCFLCTKAAPKAGQKKIEKLKKQKHFHMVAHNSVGCKVRSSRPSAGKFLESPHARDDVEPRPPWRTPSCNEFGQSFAKNKKAPRTNSNANSI